MKKLLIGASLLLPLVLLAQEGTYEINGKIAGKNTGETAYLIYRGPVGNNTDSTAVLNGEFHFTGNIEEPIKATLVVGPSLQQAHRLGSKSFYLEPGTIRITSPDSILNATVAGDAINNDYNELEEALTPIVKLREEMLNTYKAASEVERSSEAYRSTYQAKARAVSEGTATIQREFIQSHPNSLVSLDLISSVVGHIPDAEQVEQLFSLLSESVKASPAGQRYAAIVEKIKATSVGQFAPEFVQNDTSGNPVALSSFRGQYVLIDFWASWCGPCRLENPNVVAAYHQLKDKGFTVLGVSLDQPGKKDAWLKAIHDDKLEWPQVSDLKYWDNEVAKLYYIRSIPQNILVDPEGKIVAKNLRGEGLAEKLDEFISNKPILTETAEIVH